MSMKHVLVSSLRAPTERDLHNDPQSADWPFKLDGICIYFSWLFYSVELEFAVEELTE